MSEDKPGAGGEKMSGWIDIDGSFVTAGSPGKLGAIYVDLMAVTGEYGGYRTDLKKVRAIAVANDDAELVRRCDAAIGLATAAARLFNWPSGTDSTNLEAAEESVRALGVMNPAGGSGIYEYEAKKPKAAP